MKTPLKTHGGKHYLAKWIVSHFPPHLTYAEPFFGGGSVLLQRDENRDWYLEEWVRLNTPSDSTECPPLPARLRGASEVVNDIDSRLMSFWKVLRHRSHFEEFLRICQATPFSEEVFRGVLAGGEWLGFPPSDKIVERAWEFYVTARLSRQGLGNDFATLSKGRTRGGRNEQANAWINAVDQLPEIAERMRGVVMRNVDAKVFIKAEDSPTTLFYCDPPYPHGTRATKSDYQHEMTDDQHAKLLDVLAEIEGKFLLSTYPNSLYADYANKHGWFRANRIIDNKASGEKIKPHKMEVLYANYPLREDE